MSMAALRAIAAHKPQTLGAFFRIESVPPEEQDAQAWVQVSVLTQHCATLTLMQVIKRHVASRIEAGHIKERNKASLSKAIAQTRALETRRSSGNLRSEISRFSAPAVQIRQIHAMPM